MSPEATSAPTPLLSIRDLAVEICPATGPALAVDGFYLDLAPGDSLALVGESGCGKSLSALSAARLLPDTTRRVRGEILWQGREVGDFREAELRTLRGGGIGYVFQDPAAALNPVLRVGAQIAETLRLHSGRAGGETVESLLRKVRIPDPARIARAWPHELSGGMQQRVVLAAAIAARPALLIADEPTTALDVTVQAQILDLLADLREETGMALWLITHNVRLTAGRVRRLAVMYAGRIVEAGPTDRVLESAGHPYTRALLASVPGRCPPGARLPGIPGQVPDPGRWPAGCRFHPRCPLAVAECRIAPPAPSDRGPDWTFWCPRT
jgi:peptide/nickel transport system ATP-binding protein/oligopeptide transport system ATP-binding protein